MDSKPLCNTKNKSYKNGNTFEDLKVEARRISNILFEEVQEKNEISWKHILDRVDHDEIVYKLTLKFLREKGCDIGNYKKPRVVKANHPN